MEYIVNKLKILFLIFGFSNKLESMVKKFKVILGIFVICDVYDLVSNVIVRVKYYKVKILQDEKEKVIREFRIVYLL